MHRINAACKATRSLKRFLHSTQTNSQLTRFAFPAMSPTMTEGGISTWKVEEGGKFSAGDVLLEIETDKATMDVEAQDDGILAKIIVPEGTKGVKVNSLIAILGEEGDDISEAESFAKKHADSDNLPEANTNQTLPTGDSKKGVPDTSIAKKEDPVSSKQSENDEASAPLLKDTSSTKRQSESQNVQSNIFVMASPAAKRAALDKGIKLSSVQGTGPEGRILKSDVDSHTVSASSSESKQSTGKSGSSSSSAAAAAQNPVNSWTDVPLTPMRKVIAKRLTESFQNAPHFAVTTEMRMDKILELRSLFNTASESKKEAKLSVGDFITKAVAQALQDVPEVNAAWMGDSIRMYKKQDICIAVATPTGLITPIITDVGSRGLASISAETKAMAAKGRDGKLKPEEYQGGTFTISNLGMFGVNHFTAILNPPQSAILAVGGVQPKVIRTKDGRFEEVNVLNATLTCNHAVIDGAVAAKFQQALKARIENPLTMML